MKIIILILLFFIGFSGNLNALTVGEARHLLARTGFGASPGEIANILPLTREQAVDRIIEGLKTKPISEPPAFVKMPLPNYFLDKNNNSSEAKLFGVSRDYEIYQLRSWWLDQMVSTPSPLTERLVLFWHNHFVSKYSTTYVTKPFYDQLQLFRSAGTTNFSDLLKGIVHDPTMLIFLNNDLNTKDKPNENLARELLELFTLGVDQYSQKDIKELAKILAGHSVDKQETWGYQFNEGERVVGDKTFMGVRGDISPDDAIDIILKNPRTAIFVSGKFYHEFVNTKENSKAIEKLASVLRENNYALRPFLRSLFLSDDFWAKENRGALVKSPVELVIGFVRTFGVWMPDLRILDQYTEILGQELLDPPDVSGWPGGIHWLSSQQLTARKQVISRLWDAYDEAQRWQRTVGPDDLIVRFAAEDDGNHAPHYLIRVNGKDVYRGVARRPLNVNMEGDSQVPLRPKPMWEIVAMQRAQLPKEVSDIAISFEKADVSDPEKSIVSYMFVSWVQIDGERFESRVATQHFEPGDSCADTIPIGMLYCKGTITFDLRDVREAERGVDPTLADIHDPTGGTDSILEHGAVRLPLIMRPAARTNITTDIITELKITKVSPMELLLAASPLRMNMEKDMRASDDDSASLQQQLYAATLDPSYNLK